MPKSYKNQNYNSLKKRCLKQGTLFEDPEFPATSKSLFHSKIDDDIKWLRPKEIFRVPKLLVEGVTHDDLVCDDVSRSWFATACMALAHEPKLWLKVVPESQKQEWDEKNQYAGIFKFSVWRFGQWVDVVIDDRLPTRDGKLIYCRSSAKSEFWSALLEKAYAKLFGDYESMAGGQTADALVDFTGGVSEKIDFKSLTYSEPTAKNSVFTKLKDAHENKGLISAYIDANPTMMGADNGPRGLTNGLGYNITMVKEIEVKSNLQSKLGTNNLRMLRLFSPGGGSKWTGPWSPKSQEMNRLPYNEWEKMGINYEKEEEFWMSYQDFIGIFTNVNICHFLNTSFFSLKKQWHESILFSEWSHSGKNGGNTWESDTVLRNPQFMFDVNAEADVVTVSLEQRDVKGDGISSIADFNSIGFYIMKVEQNRKFRVHLKGEKVFRSEFTKSRNMFGRTELEKGRYVIVPCCENKAAIGQFMMRMYAGGGANPGELTKECPDSGCCKPKFKMVTSIEVVKADGLALPETVKGSLDPFIVINCEGQKVTSDFKKNTGSPVYNTKATFYRKNPQRNIVVEVYNRNRLINSYLCEARIDIPDGGQGGEGGATKVFDFYGKKKEAEVQKPGKLHIFIRSSHDLALL